MKAELGESQIAPHSSLASSYPTGEDSRPQTSSRWTPSLPISRALHSKPNKPKTLSVILNCTPTQHSQEASSLGNQQRGEELSLTAEGTHTVLLTLH